MIPASVRDSAFVSASDEYAWRRARLPEVVRALADAGLLILGGEAWVVRDGRICGLIPTRDGIDAVIHWSTQVRRDLPWKQLVQAAAHETLSIVPGLDAEEVVVSEYANDVWYNLTLCTQCEWEALR